MKPMRLMWAAMLAAAVILPACSRAVPDVENPIPIAAAEYDEVFDAAIDVLRDMRFTVDRKDRRFGVVTTEPLIASSVVEPWYVDNSNAYQTWDSTLNLQRRRVRVEIKPAGDSMPEATDAPTATEAALPEYTLRVLVEVDRQHHPARPIHTSALGRVTYRRAERRYRPIETEAGVETSRWEAMGRDELLERRLIGQILGRATAGV